MATSSSTLLTKYGYWSLLIPPLFVYILASSLFELSVNPSSARWPALLTTHIASQDFSSLSFKLIELKARYIWVTTILINLFACFYAASIGVIIIYRSHSFKRLIAATVMGGILIIIGLISLEHGSTTHNAMYTLIYHFSFSTLELTGLYHKDFLEQIELLLLITNILGIIVPSIVLLAASSTLAPSPKQNGDGLAHLTSQMNHIKGVLNAGSALLVGGILHMNAWLRWPTELLADPTEHAALSETVLSITMFWGATFTLILIATYGPAAGYLCTKARYLAEQAEQAGTLKDSKRWLKDNHFSITLGEQLPQISAILGPALAGPVGSFLMSHVGA